MDMFLYHVFVINLGVGGGMRQKDESEDTVQGEEVRCDCGLF